mmetsp:Transcript_24689/g.27571  ORF Transcript_24689/g.27571 Transcript_24689/m.27571 type:complete len:138 (-) Transcript_24689:132-545(-)
MLPSSDCHIHQTKNTLTNSKSEPTTQGRFSNANTHHKNLTYMSVLAPSAEGLLTVFPVDDHNITKILGLAPLKTRANGKMPAKKHKLQEAYLKWMDRPPKTFDGEIILDCGDGDGDSDDDDVDPMQNFGFYGPAANI